MSAEIEQASGRPVQLIAGGGGVFDIDRDGELVFSKQSIGRFPEPGEIARLLGFDAES